ncbi:MAG: class I SAM-dependent methyltransferase [Synechococcaceae cyanobacterium SM1_2_3]|nr:class I SAM-dependent methyltransferase [Synechococcaceae cyanobacterium SM1_2_3]
MEIGCGTGHLARELSRLEYSIVALEPATEMFQIAQEVLKNTDAKVFNSKIEDYSPKGFEPDVSLAHMCVNSIPHLDSFFSAIKHVAPKQPIVFSATHPAFWNNIEKWIPEETFEYHNEYFSDNVFLRITQDSGNPIGPISNWHRPIDFYFSCLKRSGYYVTDFHEIMPQSEVRKLYGEKWKKPRYFTIVCQPYT